MGGETSQSRERAKVHIGDGPLPLEFPGNDRFVIEMFLSIGCQN